ncbi:MAG: hypothetical protein NVS3B20_14860 [Polyangiales bacterium]
MHALRFGKRMKIALATAVAIPALGVGLIGFGHTQAGRPILSLLGIRMGCPVGYDRKVTAAEIDAYRAKSVKTLSGQGEAHDRTALGFELGKTTRADVSAWAKGAGAGCSTLDSDTALRCKGLPGSSFVGVTRAEPIDDLFFRFDGGGRLVALDATRMGVAPEEAASFLDAEGGKLRERLGPPTQPLGDHTAAFLASGPMLRSGLEYRFANYAVDLSATNVGGRGILVREQYRAIDN